MSRIALVALALFTLFNPAVAPLAAAPPLTAPVLFPAGEEGEIALGRAIFFDPRLSSSGTIQCASCHDPDRSFADGLVHSVGERGTPVGRNSPTLFGIAAIDAFVDPLKGSMLPFSNRLQALPRDLPEPTAIRVAGHELIGRAHDPISLAERCLSPLGNPAEMGSDIDQTLAIYRERVGSAMVFDRVFGGPGGATRERIGNALAAYLRTLATPEDAPYARHLAGEEDALDESEARGHALFTGKGACASCHAGESLRDGRLHAVMRPGNLRLRVTPTGSIVSPIGPPPNGNPGSPRVGEGGQVVPIDANEPIPQGLINGQLAEISINGFFPSGYGGLPMNIAATPSLWDVARTAPYFGDGTVETLDRALAQHLAELDDLRKALDESSENDGRPRPQVRPQRRVQSISSLPAVDLVLDAFARAAPELHPPGESFDEWPFPEALTEDEVADLLAFLGALSPPEIP